MKRVVEHGDGEEEGDGQGLSQAKPSPVEPDHEKKVEPQAVKATSYRVFFLTGPTLKMSLDWPPH